MFCPLGFGTVDPWSIFILQATSTILLMVWALDEMRASRVDILEPFVSADDCLCRIDVHPAIARHFRLLARDVFAIAFICLVRNPMLSAGTNS